VIVDTSFPHIDVNDILLAHRIIGITVEQSEYEELQASHFNNIVSPILGHRKASCVLPSCCGIDLLALLDSALHERPDKCPKSELCQVQELRAEFSGAPPSSNVA